VIEKIEWVWNEPCVFGQPGEIVVTITATDADTDVSELTYSGSVDQCSDITDRVTTLMCDDHPGLRGGDAIATDPQGNEGSLFFAFDPCVNGSICEGGAICP
jgi:hypothetical protein